VQYDLQVHLENPIDLTSTVVPSLIVETLRAPSQIPLCRPDYRRNGAAQLRRNAVSREARGQLRDHQEAQRGRRISRGAALTNERASLLFVEPRNARHPNPPSARTIFDGGVPAKSFR
jgi:hypothetical protein